MSWRIIWKSWLMEVKCELLKLIRTPSFSVGILAFPLMFYLLFGVALPQQKAAMAYMSKYLLATYGAAGIMSAMLFGFGVSLAIERGMGWLELKYASPMRPVLYFLAKGAVCFVFGAFTAGLLFAAGAAFAGVRMPAVHWISLGGVLVAGAIPFSAMALALGYFVNPSAAPAIANVIFMPMSFLSGLWIPLQMLPKGLQDFAPMLPAFHLGQLALGVLGFPVTGSPVGHVAVLAGFTLLFSGIAWIGHRREKRAM
jgi:ABC-2 type transport system permease protein